MSGEYQDHQNPPAGDLPDAARDANPSDAPEAPAAGPNPVEPDPAAAGPAESGSTPSGPAQSGPAPWASYAYPSPYAAQQAPRTAGIPPVTSGSAYQHGYPGGNYGTPGYRTGASEDPGYGSTPYGSPTYGYPGYGATGYGTAGYGTAGYGGGPYGTHAYPPEAPGATGPQDQPPGSGQQPGTGRPKSGRGLRRAMVIGAAAVLAIGAGFGGGVWAGHATTSNNASAVDSSQSQSAVAPPVSDNKLPAGSVEQVAAKVLPSVVSILATSSNQQDEGSGVILSKDGLILTNNHVIEGAPNLMVQFNDGTTAKATVVGGDPTDDLAVIKAQGVSGLTVASLGDSNSLVVGQPVVAIGSPLGLSATVTSGIVSALNRPVRTGSDQPQQQPQQQNPFDPFGNQNPNDNQQPQQSTQGSDGTVLNAIQTDAAINPGNSGGALVNMKGQVVGINSAIASLSQGSGQAGSIGVGFAIPIDQAKRIANEIIKTGKASHAVLGATVTDAAIDGGAMSTGAKVVQVTADGGAAKAGLKAGDVITKVGTLPIESADALVATIRSSTPGGQVEITYVRGGATHTVTATLGSTTN